MEAKKIYSLSELYSNKAKTMQQLALEGIHLKPLKKLFGNYVFEESLIHFPSERGVGKTFLGIQLCLAISNCWSSFLGEEINLHGNTLFVNCELSERLMQQRLARMFMAMGKPLENKVYESIVYTTRDGLEIELKKISNLIENYNPVLMVLDNFRMAFLKEDTNRNHVAAQAMKMILDLKDKYKMAIILTDHTRKHTANYLTTSDLQTGSGTKSDLVDGDFFLRRSSQAKNLRVLKRVKSRLSEEEENAKLISFDGDTLWFELEKEDVDELDHIQGDVINDKQEKKSLVKKLREQKELTIEEIVEKTGVPKSTVHRWINS